MSDYDEFPAVLNSAGLVSSGKFEMSTSDPWRLRLRWDAGEDIAVEGYDAFDCLTRIRL